MNKRMEAKIAEIEAMSEIERVASITGAAISRGGPHGIDLTIPFYDIVNEGTTSLVLTKVVGGYAYVRYNNNLCSTKHSAIFTAIKNELRKHRKGNAFPKGSFADN